jgi:hypothetical protein
LSACPAGLPSYYGFWSAWSDSHNIGEALTFIATAFVVSIAGWRWGFEAAGLAGLTGAVIIFLFLHDSPTSKGLVPVMPAKELGKSTGAMQLEVLKNPFIWILALSSTCMYISRYAINSWGIFFLENEKAYTTIEASSIIGVSSVCGIIGTVLSGFLSDKLFKGSRNVPALLFGTCNSIAITLFVFVPKGYFALDIFSMILFGLSIGALICYLGGMMAVDIAPKKASGAALGVVGIASYIGAGIQDILSGRFIGDSKTVVDGITTYDFSSIRYFWIGGRRCHSCCAPACGKEPVKPKSNINNISINNLLTQRGPSENPGTASFSFFKQFISTKLFFALQEASQKNIDIKVQVLENNYDKFAGTLFSATTLSQNKVEIHSILCYTRVEFSVLQKSPRTQKKSNALSQ